MLENDRAVSLEKVNVDLTILKHEPRSVKLEDETTYNEIEYLKEIAFMVFAGNPNELTQISSGSTTLQSSSESVVLLHGSSEQ